MIMHMNGFFAAHSDLDVDAPLYRIMPKKHLEQLLQTNTLYFRKVALWDDTWEVPSKFWKSTGKDVSYSKIELANISQKDLYGTCWTDDIDSDAMWRIYSYYKDGIAIQTTIRKLFQSIDFFAFLIAPNFVDGFIGPVRYENIDGNVFFDDKSYQYPEYMVPSYIKRNAFAHEKEIRFLLCAPNYLEFHPTNELGITSDSSGLHLPLLGNGFIENGNVKKCAVGKHPKSEKHGNTAQFSEVERSGTQENCGGIGSGCRLRLRPLPVLHRRQSQRVARIDPNAVVVDKNIAENDRFDLFSRQLVRRNLIDLLFLERGEKALHPCVVEAMSDAAEALYHAAARQLCAKSCAGVLTPAI